MLALAEHGVTSIDPTQCIVPVDRHAQGDLATTPLPKAMRATGPLCATAALLLFVVTQPVRGQDITGSYPGCSTVAFGSSVQSSLGDPFAQYGLIPDSLKPPGQQFPLVRFDGPRGTVSVLRQTSGTAYYLLAGLNPDVMYLEDVDDIVASSRAVYRTVDRGTSWTKLTGVPPCPNTLAAVSSDGNSVIVGSPCSSQSTSPRISHDRGQTWQNLNAQLSSGTIAYFSSADSRVVYVQNWLGISRSTDGGASFQAMAMRGYRRDLSFAAFTDWTDPALIYVVTAGNSGIHFQVSTNGGNDWTVMPNYPGFLDLGIAPGSAGRVYATAYNSRSIIRSDDFGRTWRTLTVSPGVTARCSGAPQIRAGVSSGGTRPLYPENQFLILLESEPDLDSATPVPLARWTMPGVAMLVMMTVALCSRRKSRVRAGAGKRARDLPR